MAEVDCDGIHFSAQLFVELDRSTMADGRKGVKPVRLDELTQFAVSDSKPKEGRPAYEELWILSPELDFKGVIRAEGDPRRLEGWRAGLSQTIRSSNRIGTYSGGRTWHLRLNTAFGSLKDGQHDSLFYVEENRFEPSQTGGTAAVREQDAPNFTLPTRYSGDPANPSGGQGAPGVLEETDGEDVFVSYLAAAHFESRSIITLGRCTWTVSWRGRYDAGQKLWRPAALPMTRHDVADVGEVHVRITAQGLAALPFSLMMAEAEEYREINAPGGFRASKMSGAAVERGQPDTRRWVV